jgi:hypothetical protein
VLRLTLLEFTGCNRRAPHNWPTREESKKPKEPAGIGLDGCCYAKLLFSARLNAICGDDSNFLANADPTDNLTKAFCVDGRIAEIHYPES